MANKIKEIQDELTWNHYPFVNSDQLGWLIEYINSPFFYGNRHKHPWILAQNYFQHILTVIDKDFFIEPFHYTVEKIYEIVNKVELIMRSEGRLDCGYEIVYMSTEYMKTKHFMSWEDYSTDFEITWKIK